MNRTFVTGVFAIAIFSAAPGLEQHNPAGANDRAAQEINQLESQRITAMVAADTATLNRILADDLTYTHSTGRTESKAQFIASIKSGAIRYQTFNRDDVSVRTYESAAVVTGTAKVKVTSGGQEQAFLIRFVDVYVKRKGSWQMVAWQSTRLAQP